MNEHDFLLKFQFPTIIFNASKAQAYFSINIYSARAYSVLLHAQKWNILTEGKGEQQFKNYTAVSP